jgi:protein-S-isoprenylcysteine O-methyltransferase Ste14
MPTHKNRSLAWPLWMTLLTAQIALSLFLYNSAGNQALQIVGWIIGASAGFLGVWPIITLRRKGESPSGKSYIHTTVLVNSGIYAIIRHPQYLSFMLFNLFLMLIVQHWLIVAIGIAAIAMAYTGIMPQADRANVKKFGAAYESYMQETPGVNLLAGIIRYLRRIW